MTLFELFYTELDEYLKSIKVFNENIQSYSNVKANIIEYLEALFIFQKKFEEESQFRFTMNNEMTFKDVMIDTTCGNESEEYKNALFEYNYLCNKFDEAMWSLYHICSRDDLNLDFKKLMIEVVENNTALKDSVSYVYSF